MHYLAKYIIGMGGRFLFGNMHVEFGKIYRYDHMMSAVKFGIRYMHMLITRPENVGNSSDCFS